MPNNNNNYINKITKHHTLTQFLGWSLCSEFDNDYYHIFYGWQNRKHQQILLYSPYLNVNKTISIYLDYHYTSCQGEHSERIVQISFTTAASRSKTCHNKKCWTTRHLLNRFSDQRQTHQSSLQLRHAMYNASAVRGVWITITVAILLKITVISIMTTHSHGVLIQC